MGLHWATPGHLLNTDVFLGDINQFVAKVGKKLSTLETPHLINQLCPEAFLIRTFLGPIETCSFNSNSGQFLLMEAILLSLSAIFALQLLRTICGRVCVYTGDKRYHLQSPLQVCIRPQAAAAEIYCVSTNPALTIYQLPPWLNTSQILTWTPVSRQWWQWALELSTNLREVSQCLVLPLFELKEPTSAFTIKNILRH